VPACKTHNCTCNTGQQERASRRNGHQYPTSWCLLHQQHHHMHAFQAHAKPTGWVCVINIIILHTTALHLPPAAPLHAATMQNRIHHACTAFVKTATTGICQPSRLPPGQDPVFPRTGTLLTVHQWDSAETAHDPHEPLPPACHQA
jgi:hypothetical protein